MNVKKNQLMIQITIFLVTIIFSVVNIFLLPDIVAVQWNADGASNFISKFTAVLIPIGIVILVFMVWRYSCYKYSMQIQSSSKFKMIHQFVFVLFSCVGIIINIIFLFLNK